MRKIRIAISSCLLGQPVRYDGGHKRDAYLVDTLARHVEFVPVCPEVAIGLGVPRPPIHLVDGIHGVRALGRDDPRLDVTVRLRAYGRRMARELADVSGYVFKRGSPSCGLDTPVHGGKHTRRGRGVYADAFLAHHPDLPAEEAERLADPAVRDNFLERVLAYRRWQEMCARRLSPARWQAFHAAHRLALMAHRPRAFAALGRIAARPPTRAAKAAYLSGFMGALSEHATPRQHAEVLEYAIERFAPAPARPRLRAALGRFRRGALSRAALLARLRRALRHQHHADSASQTYLHPDARERRLRGL
jgi:uncharacterized protein YbbK (DUF523 family)/uncharacterized protein YbgA (DUF1722 family)